MKQSIYILKLIFTINYYYSLKESFSYSCACHICWILSIMFAENKSESGIWRFFSDFWWLLFKNGLGQIKLIWAQSFSPLQWNNHNSNNVNNYTIFKNLGATGWLSGLSVWLQLRSRSHGSWVRALHLALSCQHRFYVSLSLCVPLPFILPLSKINKNIEKCNGMFTRSSSISITTPLQFEELSFSESWRNTGTNLLLKKSGWPASVSTILQFKVYAHALGLALRTWNIEQYLKDKGAGEKILTVAGVVIRN